MSIFTKNANFAIAERMKTLVPITLFVFFVAPAFAQQKALVKTPSLGVHATFFDFGGADSIKAFGKNMRPGLAIHFQNNVTRHLDYAITAAGSFLEFFNKKNASLSNGEKKLLLEADVSAKLKLTAPEKRIKPYLQGGVGVSVYTSHPGIFIPVGLGCQVDFTNDLFLLFNTQYRMPVTTSQHRHFYHSIGLAGAITRKKTNKVVPVVPPLPMAIPQQVDSDGDGILDSADRCPTVAGMLKYQGCPPPDRDGDRIIDEEDECPDVKGEAAYKGCPPPANHTYDTSAKAKLDSAAQMVFFETNSHTLMKKSYPALQQVARILTENPALQLIIEGHTDNAGTVNGNQLLSERRAQSVKNYLIKSGIETARLQAIGYGQAKPIEDNGTAEGRARNRRVVFAIKE